MRKLILLFTLSLPLVSGAEDICVDEKAGALSDITKVAEAVTAEADGNCPDPRPLRGICEHVITPDLVDNELSYITRFKKAGCVKPEDSEEVANRKIREAWSKYEDRLVCDSIAFEIRGGSILKAASISANKNFYNTVLKWKVNLNRIDPADGRTVLDYIRDEMKKNPPNIEFYRAYYSVLKEHGAKHRSEL